MPPEKKPQPSEEQKKLIVSFLDGQLAKPDCVAVPSPGRVTIRRLNREEYRNTIRDLLKVDFYPEDFPNDEVGYGFDNIGDVLSLSPMLMEKYLAAAETVARKAIVTNSEPVVQKSRGNEFTPTGKGNLGLEDGALALMVEGDGTRALEFPQAGEYVIRIHAYGDQAGPEAPRMRLSLDGREVDIFDVKASDHHAAQIRDESERGERVAQSQRGLSQQLRGHEQPGPEAARRPQSLCGVGRGSGPARRGLAAGQPSPDHSEDACRRRGNRGRAGSC